MMSCDSSPSPIKFVRRVCTVEQYIHLELTGDQLVELIARVLENLHFSEGDPEIALCAAHWEELKKQPRFGPDWSLHAKAVLDRASRALSQWIDSTYQLLQPKAEFLGRAFKADDWTITLFSEEVVRGNSLGFVLSMLLHHLEPILRKQANLGNWQIISRGRGRGVIEVVCLTLRARQNLPGADGDCGGPRLMICQLPRLACLRRIGSR